ncbi:hypothetical protein [Massilia sp. Root351]|uniref:hypothetical protein n=1 Tax=Massilia sp. Root351 TaxID=1736522 RepID=UPI000B2193B8|nr:hypothetical protein [Massilia sp. Root351]
MDKSTPPQRPDLFAAVQPGDGSRRILARLENSGKANTPGARLARLQPGQLVMRLALLAMVAAAIAGVSYHGLAPAQRSQPVVLVAPVAPLVIAPDEVERRAAAIVNEPLPAITPLRRKLAAVAIAAGPRAPQVRQGHQASQAPAAPHSPTHSATSPASRSAAPVHTAAVPPADSDLALLTALVAHSGNQPGAGPHRRDEVERNDGDSTDALLRRCQRLGGPEAGLCRARICNGQWLHAAACRMPIND